MPVETRTINVNVNYDTEKGDYYILIPNLIQSKKISERDGLPSTVTDTAFYRNGKFVIDWPFPEKD